MLYILLSVLYISCCFTYDIYIYVQSISNDCATAACSRRRYGHLSSFSVEVPLFAHVHCAFLESKPRVLAAGAIDSSKIVSPVPHKRAKGYLPEPAPPESVYTPVYKATAWGLFCGLFGGVSVGDPAVIHHFGSWSVMYGCHKTHNILLGPEPEWTCRCLT